jgi:hypothetical protein
MPQIQLALHRQLGLGELSLGFFGGAPAFRGVHEKKWKSILVAFHGLTSQPWKYFSSESKILTLSSLRGNKDLQCGQ